MKFLNGTHEYDVEKKVCFTTPSETSHTRRVSVWRDALAYTLVFEVLINSRQSKFMSCKCHCDIYEYMNLIYKYLTSQKSKYPRFYQFTLKKNVNLCNFESTELKVPDKDWSMLSGYGLVLIRCRHRRTHVKTMCTPGHVIIEIKAISKWNEEKVNFKKMSRFLVSKRNLLLRICIIYFIWLHCKTISPFLTVVIY